MSSSEIDNFLKYAPPLRGRVTRRAEISNSTWFRTGGCAEFLFKPKDYTDLSNFLNSKPKSLEHTILGVGSNVLVRDGGIPGVTIKLRRGFSHISIEENHGEIIINVGAATLDSNVAKIAADSGLEGLEFLSGVPGTIGGALRMNAGAFGREMSDIVVSAIVLTSDGSKKFLLNKDLGFEYRKCSVPKDWIFIEATLCAHKGDPKVIAKNMSQISEYRIRSQPIRALTGGSTFKNPNGQKAWKLIEDAGCRGLQVGEAEISKKHCNFIINKNNATASDIEDLGEEVRARVESNSGIKLEWEIERIGNRIKSFSGVG